MLYLYLHIHLYFGWQQLQLHLFANLKLHLSLPKLIQGTTYLSAWYLSKYYHFIGQELVIYHIQHT